MTATNTATAKRAPENDAAAVRTSESTAPTCPPANPKRLFGSLEYLVLTGFAALVSAVWGMGELNFAERLGVATAAAQAIVAAIVVCAGLAVALVWLVSLREERAGRRYRESLARLLADPLSSDAAQPEATIALESQPEPTAPRTLPHPVNYSDAGTGSIPTRTAWLPWSAFSRLVIMQKAYTRECGQPFTLLRLRPVSSPAINEPHAVRFDTAQETTCKLQESLDATMRPSDVASFAPSGDCFLLMPETVHEIGRAFAGRLTKQLRTMLGDERLVEVRQFTFVGGTNSLASQPMAA